MTRTAMFFYFRLLVLFCVALVSVSLFSFSLMIPYLFVYFNFFGVDGFFVVEFCPVALDFSLEFLDAELAA